MQDIGNVGRVKSRVQALYKVSHFYLTVVRVELI